jgi:hypothetical protein
LTDVSGSAPGDEADGQEKIVQPTQNDKRVFRQKQNDATELERSNSATTPESISADSGIPGLGSVRGLLQATFFMDLFCHHADRRYKHLSRQARVVSLIGEAPKFYAFCLIADVTFRVATALVLLAALSLVAFLTISKVFAS